MANYFNLTLDTLGPASPKIVIASNATYSTDQLVQVAISTTDNPTTGYQMKFWGDIDLAWAKTNGIVGAAATTVLESDGLWITYETSKQFKLSATDGNKTINMKLRDDVYNESALASDSITLDTTRPIVTITGPDASEISKRAGKNTAAFSFSVDSVFNEYKQ